MLNGRLYGFFISIHHSISTFELEENYLFEMSLWESVEYNVVTSFTDENHIFRCVWEVWECWKYLLIDLTKNTISWASDCCLSDFFMLMEWYDSHDKYPDDESAKSAEDECERIHFPIYYYGVFYIVSPHYKKANMISLILHHDPIVRDTFVRVLSLEKKITDIHGNTLYQKGKWLYLALTKPLAEADMKALILEYQPENVYLPSFGRSIDMVHEETDIVLPNVFLTYDPLIESVEFSEGNRDGFLGQAEFLEIYQEQKDYYVEDYGLSVGGIAVDNVPSHVYEKHSDALMYAYEADIYLYESLRECVSIIRAEELPAIITCGIIEGKKPKNPVASVLDTTVRNMVTTWRLMEEDTLETV